MEEGKTRSSLKKQERSREEKDEGSTSEKSWINRQKWGWKRG